MFQGIFSDIIRILRDFFTVIHDNCVANIISNPDISYGVAIILFTIIIRALLLPLNIKQMKSQLKMNEIQPELKRLQERYKNDPQKANMEVMKLYKERGVNPFAGCLPLLIQMPILLALFWVFKGLFNSIHPVPGFMWMSNLVKPDPYHILPILSGLTTYVSSSLVALKGDSAQAKQTSTMNIFMAGMLLIMSWKMNASLVLYWVIGNIFQICQSYIMKIIREKSLEDA